MIGEGMKVESLEQLQWCLQSPSAEKKWVLKAGIHEVRQTLLLTRPDVEICGECRNGSILTVLRRGRLPDGSLFSGAIIQGEGVRDLYLHDILVDGCRWEKSDRGMTDHRHPVTVDKSSRAYLQATPNRGDRWEFTEEDHYTPFETDLLFFGSEHIALQSMVFRDPIKFAVGFGDGVRGAVVEDVEIHNGGEGGLWCGLALLDVTVPLPLPEYGKRKLPREISLRHCRVENCGGPGVYLDAAAVTMEDCLLQGNHSDFPHNHDGGQLEITYRSEDVLVRDCAILNAPSLRRTHCAPGRQSCQAEGRARILRAVGIEAFGRRLRFEDNRLEGNSHEGLLLNGASDVRIYGSRTHIASNHTAAELFPELREEPRQNISVTTLAAQAALGAVAGDIAVEGIRCENGLMFWSDGSVPDLHFHGITVRDCDLRGKAGSGLFVGNNAAGRSLRGEGWLVESNLL